MSTQWVSPSPVGAPRPPIGGRGAPLVTTPFQRVDTSAAVITSATLLSSMKASGARLVSPSGSYSEITRPLEPGTNIRAVPHAPPRKMGVPPQQNNPLQSAASPQPLFTSNDLLKMMNHGGRDGARTQPTNQQHGRNDDLQHGGKGSAPSDLQGRRTIAGRPVTLETPQSLGSDALRPSARPTLSPPRPAVAVLAGPVAAHATASSASLHQHVQQLQGTPSAQLRDTEDPQLGSSLTRWHDNTAHAHKVMNQITVDSLLKKVYHDESEREKEYRRFLDGEFPAKPPISREELRLHRFKLLLLAALFSLLVVETLCHFDVSISATSCWTIEEYWAYAYKALIGIVLAVCFTQLFFRFRREGLKIVNHAEARAKLQRLLYQKSKFHFLRRAALMKDRPEIGDVMMSQASPRRGKFIPHLPVLAQMPSLTWGAPPRRGDYTIFGSKMREKHFKLDPCFLNAASYGATPTKVREAKDQWDVIIQKAPSSVIEYAVPQRLDAIIEKLSYFLGSNPANTALMTNANQATSAILKSLPWTLGDRILIFSVDYDATKLAMEWLHRHFGVEIVTFQIKLPITDAALLRNLRKFLADEKDMGHYFALANFCHVTSKTAWIFPAKALVTLFHEFSIPVIIDGAQAAGHLPIDIDDIGADWYLGTVHKWLYSCQGVAFLVTSPSKKATTFPLNVSLYRFQSWKEEFSTFSNHDWPTWLSVDTALDFIEKVCGGIENIRGYIAQQVDGLTTLIKNELGTHPVQLVRDGTGAENHHGAMPIFPLPGGENLSNQAAIGAMAFLLTKKITAFLLCETFDGVSKVCIRCSCQIYTDMEDWAKMVHHIKSLDGKYGAKGILVGMMSGGGDAKKKKKKGEAEDNNDAMYN